MSRRRSLSRKATSLQRRTWAKAKKQEQLKDKATDPFNWHTDEPETEVNPFPYPADAAPILDEEEDALQMESLDEEEDALQMESLDEEEDALQMEPLDEEEDALQTEPLDEEDQDSSLP